MAKKDMKRREAFEISDENLEKVSGGEVIHTEQYYDPISGKIITDTYTGQDAIDRISQTSEQSLPSSPGIDYENAQG